MDFNKVKIYCITYNILYEENLVLHKFLFTDYCKKQLTHNQYVLFLILNTIYCNNNHILKGTVYDFIFEYISTYKENLIQQLLYI